MAKATNNPTGSEQIEIQLADNGIILRDCADPDSVFLALYDRNRPQGDDENAQTGNTSGNQGGGSETPTGDLEG